MRKGSIANIILTTSVASFLTYKVIEEVITRLLVSNALDRKTPWIMTKLKPSIKGNSVADPMSDQIASESARIESLDLERLTLIAADGTKLIGRFRPAPDAKRLIVAMHGWRSCWSRDFGAVFDFLYNNGCSVLYAVQRAQGESGGKYMGFGSKESSDCVKWANWINERTDSNLPMYLYGVSMGASSVLMASSCSLPSNVRGIISDCGFTSAREIWKYVLENNLRIPFSKRESRANDFYRKRLGYDLDKYSTIDALKKTKIPVLFIHGTDDTFVPIEMTYANYSVCASSKRLLVIPGAAHARSSWIDPETYKKTLIGFWDDLEKDTNII